VSDLTQNERQQLMVNCQGLVRALAWKIHRRVSYRIELEDLVSYGQIGLAEAARDFDPDRGVQFTTYAYHRIRGAIFDGLGTLQWFKHANYHRGQYEPLAADLANENESPPGDSLDEDVSWLRGLSRTLAVVHLFCQLDARPIELMDKTQASPSDVIARHELILRLVELVENLPPDDRDLIKAVYFQGESLTVAADRLGISKSWASRMHARALDSLSHALRQEDRSKVTVRGRHS
jgi:RNA polymerase sigma factor FliA